MFSKTAPVEVMAVRFGSTVHLQWTHLRNLIQNGVVLER
jgi:hypothetical protein